MQDVLTGSPRVGVERGKFIEINRHGTAKLKTGKKTYKDYHAALDTLAKAQCAPAADGPIWMGAKDKVTVKGFRDPKEARYHPICAACTSAFQLLVQDRPKAARAEQLLQMLALSDEQLLSRIRECLHAHLAICDYCCLRLL